MLFTLFKVEIEAILQVANEFRNAEAIQTIQNVSIDVSSELQNEPVIDNVVNDDVVVVNSSEVATGTVLQPSSDEFEGNVSNAIDTMIATGSVVPTSIIDLSFMFPSTLNEQASDDDNLEFVTVSDVQASILSNDDDDDALLLKSN